MQSFNQSQLSRINLDSILIRRISMTQIDACKKGDKNALGQIYTQYAPKLLRVCRFYVKDENTAEDILHDAFIIIFYAIKDLKDPQKLEGWMTTIVKNLALKYLQDKQQKTVSLSEINSDIAEDPQPQAPKIQLDVLLSAIESLPQGNREVFKLSVLDGLSHKDIANLLGIHPHSSSSQLHRARKILKVLLANYRIWLVIPLLLPLYFYFFTKEKRQKVNSDTSVAQDQSTNNKSQKTKNSPIIQKEKTPYTVTDATIGHSRHTMEMAEEKKQPKQDANNVETIDKIEPVKINIADSMHKILAVKMGITDSILHPQPLSEESLLAINVDLQNIVVKPKKYPWMFNMGYSSHAGSQVATSNLNYISMIDYANNGATTKIYTWDDYHAYIARNNNLIDSLERASLYRIVNDAIQSNAIIGESVHHHRPKSFSLSLTKQLSPRWTFGTGLTYTTLLSEFKSNVGQSVLEKQQKISYVGLPLRMTYQIWGKDNFYIYTTGGVTMEMPVSATLNKKYIVTNDSSFTQKEDIKANWQWSVNFGLGVQYKLFKPISVYIEPNIFYYFNNGSGLETYRTEHPFIITVPFGFRLTW